MMKQHVRYQDLNKYQRAVLKEFRKDGILLTPDQVVKIASGQINYRPRAKPLTALHLYGEDEKGHLEPLLEARRSEVDTFRKQKKANPDYKSLWQQKKMSLSLNLPKGYLSLSAHGGVHFVTQSLQEYDEETLLGILLGRRFFRKGCIPQTMRFPKELRTKIAKMFQAMVERRGSRLGDSDDPPEDEPA